LRLGDMVFDRSRASICRVCRNAFKALRLICQEAVTACPDLNHGNTIGVMITGRS